MKQVVSMMMSAWLFLAACAFGQRKGEPTYAEATFEYSRDPTRVVLHVIVTTPDLITRTMTVYGDGRLDLEIRTGTETTLDEHSRQTSTEELDRILRDAVDHGLIEWDEGRIHSLQLTSRGGRGYGPPSDSQNVTLLISVTEYRRGSYQLKDVERTIRLRGPEYVARDFPEIVEFTGIHNLVAQLDREFKEAEKMKK